MSAPAFVGRYDEWLRLRDALKHPGSITLVAGEAGIGKSRLVQEALSGRPAAGAVLRAFCPPLETPLTLGPIVGGIRAVAAAAEEQGRAARTVHAELDALAGALRPLFPDWADTLPPALPPLDDPQAARLQLFTALRQLIAAYEVTLLVLEDVHWVDTTTLEFLLDMISQPSSPSLVATYRPGDLPATSLVRRLLNSSRPGVHRTLLELHALDVESAAALVSSMLGGEPVSDELVRTLLARTDGLPLALEESVRLLLERDSLVRRDGIWSAGDLDDLGVPPLLRDAFLERVADLPPDAVRLLQVTAVLAEDATAERAVRVSGLDELRGYAALEAAVGSGLLAEEEHGQLRFRHVLAAKAVDDALPRFVRRALHLSAGRELESVIPLPLARLVHHFQVAGDLPTWAEYVERLAKTAMASGDDAGGITLLADLVDNTGLDPHLRQRVAVEIARLRIFYRPVEEALLTRVVRTLQGATELPDLTAAERASVRARRGTLLFQLEQFAEGRAELVEALPDLDSTEQIARTLVFLGIPYGSRLPAEEHLYWLRRAAAVPLEEVPARERLSLRVNLLTSLLLLGDETGWDLMDTLPEAYESPREGQELAVAFTNSAGAALLWGRYQTVRDYSARATMIASVVQADRALRALASTGLHLDLLTGAWTGLAERLETLLSGGQVPNDETRFVDTVFRMLTRSSDRGPEALLATISSFHSGDLGAEAAALLAELHLDRGDVRAALAATDARIEQVKTRELWIWGAELLPVRVQALLLSGRPEEAAQLHDSFAAGLGDVGAPRAQIALAHSRELLADHAGRPIEETSAAWAAVAERWDALPMPRRAAAARRIQAAALARAGLTEEATELFASVRAALEALGSVHDLETTTAVMVEVGLARRRTVGRIGYGDALSPRELEVLELLVSGKSNREISELLVLSPKTVARHLESARRKLKVGSRTALVVKALEAGILPDLAS